jgi:hypothetical protein
MTLDLAAYTHRFLTDARDRATVARLLAPLLGDVELFRWPYHLPDGRTLWLVAPALPRKP